MATRAICTYCGTRREACVNLSAHKKRVKWRADVHFSRGGGRLRKTFQTKELADIQERQWMTDYERGQLLPSERAVALPFAQIADEWMASANSQNRIKDSHRSEIYRVRMFKDLFGSRLISSIEFSDGQKWLNQRLISGKTVNTINRDMKTLNWIMNYAVSMSYIKENPFKKLQSLKNGNVHERWLNQAEFDKLLNAAKLLGDDDLCDVMMVGVNTGFRKGNLERLSIKDIAANRILAAQTKSGKPYSVPISQALYPILQRLVMQHPIGPLLNTKKLDRRFREAARLAGFYSKKGDLTNVTIHTLRHTFAAMYLKRGGDVYKLSKLLGHSSITITEKVYAHLCPTDIDAQAPLIGSRPVQESNLPLIAENEPS